MFIYIQEHKFAQIVYFGQIIEKDSSIQLIQKSAQEEWAKNDPKVLNWVIFVVID